MKKSKLILAAAMVPMLNCFDVCSVSKEQGKKNEFKCKYISRGFLQSTLNESKQNAVVEIDGLKFSQYDAEHQTINIGDISYFLQDSVDDVMKALSANVSRNVNISSSSNQLVKFVDYLRYYWSEKAAELGMFDGVLEQKMSSLYNKRHCPDCELRWMDYFLYFCPEIALHLGLFTSKYLDMKGPKEFKDFAFNNWMTWGDYWRLQKFWTLEKKNISSDVREGIAINIFNAALNHYLSAEAMRETLLPDGYLFDDLSEDGIFGARKSIEDCKKDKKLIDNVKPIVFNDRSYSQKFFSHEPTPIFLCHIKRLCCAMSENDDYDDYMRQEQWRYAEIERQGKIRKADKRERIDRIRYEDGDRLTWGEYIGYRCSVVARSLNLYTDEFLNNPMPNVIVRVCKLPKGLTWLDFFCNYSQGHIAAGSVTLSDELLDTRVSSAIVNTDRQKYDGLTWRDCLRAYSGFVAQKMGLYEGLLDKPFCDVISDPAGIFLKYKNWSFKEFLCCSNIEAVRLLNLDEDFVCFYEKFKFGWEDYARFYKINDALRLGLYDGVENDILPKKVTGGDDYKLRKLYTIPTELIVVQYRGMTWNDYIRIRATKEAIERGMFNGILYEAMSDSCNKYCEWEGKRWVEYLLCFRSEIALDLKLFTSQCLNIEMPGNLNGDLFYKGMTLKEYLCLEKKDIAISLDLYDDDFFDKKVPVDYFEHVDWKGRYHGFSLSELTWREYFCFYSRDFKMAFDFNLYASELLNAFISDAIVAKFPQYKGMKWSEYICRTDVKLAKQLNLYDDFFNKKVPFDYLNSFCERNEEYRSFGLTWREFWCFENMLLHMCSLHMNDSELFTSNLFNSLMPDSMIAKCPQYKGMTWREYVCVTNMKERSCASNREFADEFKLYNDDFFSKKVPDAFIASNHFRQDIVWRDYFYIISKIPTSSFDKDFEVFKKMEWRNCVPFNLGLTLHDYLRFYRPNYAKYLKIFRLNELLPASILYLKPELKGMTWGCLNVFTQKKVLLNFPDDF